MISNMFPTARNPRSGIFIDQRIHAHHSIGNVVKAVALTPTPSPALVALLAAFRKGPSPVISADYFELQVTIPSIDYLRQASSRFPSTSLLRRTARNLAQVLDLSDFDVIHAHGMYVFPAGALAHQLSVSTGLPYAITTHGSDINVMMPHYPTAYASVLDSAGAVAYVSDALRVRAQALGARGENATVIPNGVDCELFTPPESDSDTSMPQLRPRVAFVGNLSSVKGADLLPEIFRGIARRVPDISFVIAGNGPLRPAIESAMNGVRVDFLGNISQEQVAQALRKIDLAVLPSRSEGWPCVVLEAQASGTPIIGSDAGGTPEAIGDPRFVISRGDNFVERFVDTAVQVLSGSVQPGNMRSRALNYSWQRIATLETEMLMRIAGRSSGTIQPHDA